ncbi:MAG: hypothetical protein IT438_16375 [Phycisphaerales bacterium]|nr:hypothetical protein [Phycisphaerales bacterium]
MLSPILIAAMTAVVGVGCQSSVKVDPAKSEATRTENHGKTTIRATVWPKGVKP